jgi:NADH dehydrogenase FAD-containing subunit
MTANTEVVVIGGGYAGVIAANHLRVREGVRITLINPRPSFVERIRLHQLVTGSDDAVVDYETVLGAGIRLIVDEASAIDTAQRSVVLASGGAVGYDYLVYAVGSAAPHRPSGRGRVRPPRRRARARQRLRAAATRIPPHR